MTFKYNDIYINATATIVGPYEANSPFNKLFDFNYDDLYFGLPTWEQAESKIINEVVDLLLKKYNITNADLLLSSDLLNQLAASNYAAVNTNFFYIGVYAACASSALQLALAACLIESGFINNAICVTSSHNNGAEKQFRYPTEYGGPKPKSATFTATGSAAAFVSNKKSHIKIDSATIGKVIDSNLNDAFNMGGVMAKAAGDTIYNHLKETSRDIDYYDLVLTGDLGVYGKKILTDYMKSEYNINLKNYNDSGTMLYNKDICAGASGPVCLPLITYSYVFNEMNKKKLKRVLLVATGSLHSTTMVNQKLTIPSIAHAISLEAIR